MQEIYIVTSANGFGIEPYSGQYGVDKKLIEILKSDNLMELMPVTSQGDPDLVRTTVYELRDGSGGGVVVLYNSDMEPQFCVIARRKRELAEASSHFAALVSRIRYGADIFDTVTAQRG